MEIYDDLLKCIRRKIQLHEIVGDFAIATESLKIYLDEWEERSKLHQPTVSGSVCKSEWCKDKAEFDGYCDTCFCNSTN
jgi:hypothetical protein